MGVACGIRREKDPANKGIHTCEIGSGLHVLKNVVKGQKVHKTNDSGREQKNILKYCVKHYHMYILSTDTFSCSALACLSLFKSVSQHRQVFLAVTLHKSTCYKSAINVNVSEGECVVRVGKI